MWTKEKIKETLQASTVLCPALWKFPLPKPPIPWEESWRTSYVFMSTNQRKRNYIFFFKNKRVTILCLGDENCLKSDFCLCKVKQSAFTFKNPYFLFQIWKIASSFFLNKAKFLLWAKDGWKKWCGERRFSKSHSAPCWWTSEQQ